MQQWYKPDIVHRFYTYHCINTALIWMVDDTLNFTDDYIIYSLSRLNNRTKRLDFLYKNKLIYAFQKNIVKNQKFSKYFNWFELAEKTRNKLNEKADFLKYAEDDIFAEIMKRISRETLKDEDFTYIDDYEKFIERVKRYEKGIYEDGKVEGIEIGKEQGIEIGKEQGIEIGKDEEKLAIAKRLKQKGMDAAAIFEITGIPERRIV